jgi:hypothetical protein
MNLKSGLLIIALCLLAVSPAIPNDRGSYLNVCQELVSSARTYEARSAHHSRVAKQLQSQIENLSRMPRNDSTGQVIDNLFAQYDENRQLESKFRDLFRQSSDEAKKCMKSAE